VESLSAYARQFLERMEKPDVDAIEGICPAIAIRQKNSIRNPRSTVGTVTEIHDYLRLLYARVGRTYCRSCGREVIRETAEVVAARLSELPEGARLLIGFDMPIVATSPLAVREHEPEEDEVAGDAVEEDTSAPQPVLPDLVDPIAEMLSALRRKGFGRLYVDGRTVALEEAEAASLKDRAMLQVIVDRVKVDPGVRARLTDSIETAYTEGGGAAFAIEGLPPDSAKAEGGSHEKELDALLIVVLDGIEDPHNAGAILRTADAAGADGVVRQERHAAALDGVVAKASAGALAHVRIATVVNIARAIDELKEAGVWTIGLAGDAPEPYTAPDYTLPTALVLGAEGTGLRRLVRDRCDRLVRIPMRGAVESLNVSVAAGVVLFEVVRQRMARAGGATT
jgi:tRNA G18 (ribose-2'-O)-methylase SpoU